MGAAAQCLHARAGHDSDDGKQPNRTVFIPRRHSEASELISLTEIRASLVTADDAPLRLRVYLDGCRELLPLVSGDKKCERVLTAALKRASDPKTDASANALSVELQNTLRSVFRWRHRHLPITARAVPHIGVRYQFESSQATASRRSLTEHYDDVSTAGAPTPTARMRLQRPRNRTQPTPTPRTSPALARFPSDRTEPGAEEEQPALPVAPSPASVAHHTDGRWPPYLSPAPQQGFLRRFVPRSRPPPFPAMSAAAPSTLQGSRSPADINCTSCESNYRGGLLCSLCGRAACPACCTTRFAVEKGQGTTAALRACALCVKQLQTASNWQADAESKQCRCGAKFTAFVRRHHCRLCGRLVCATCSRRRILLCKSRLRACDDCILALPFKA